MAWPKALLLLALLAGQTPQYPPPYPRPGTTPVFENDVIAVWDVAWLEQKYPLHTHRYDLIGVSYVEGDRIITQGDAPGRLTSTNRVSAAAWSPMPLASTSRPYTVAAKGAAIAASTVGSAAATAAAAAAVEDAASTRACGRFSASHARH